jgi:hypothetical protein
LAIITDHFITLLFKLNFTIAISACSFTKVPGDKIFFFLNSNNFQILSFNEHLVDYDFLLEIFYFDLLLIFYQFLKFLLVLLGVNRQFFVRCFFFLYWKLKRLETI